MKPTTEDVLKWGREVWGTDLSDWKPLPEWFSNFEAFAALAYAAGAAAEREECAKVCELLGAEDYAAGDQPYDIQYIAAIRARGEKNE